MLEKRLKETRARYQRWYKIDFLDKSNYDLVVDTTNLSKKEVIDKILGFVKKKI